MIKKIGFILIAIVIVSATAFVFYQELFIGSNEFKDISIAFTEGEIIDKEKVKAECSIADENRFCFKDIAWADMQNEVEFAGYIVVEYSNDSDFLTEISTGTAKLENITEGVLVIRSTDPSDIFIAKDETVAIRYAIYLDTDDEVTDQVHGEGAEFSATLTSEFGKTATEIFSVEYKN